MREEGRNYIYYRQIQECEVKEALKRMIHGKAVGSDIILIKVWESLWDRGIEWFIQLFNEIMKLKQMSNEWRKNALILIYKNTRVYKIVQIIEKLNLWVITWSYGEKWLNRHYEKRLMLPIIN